MKAVGTIIGACLIILMLGAVIAGILDFRSAKYIEPHNVTTAPAATTADVVLTQELFQDETAYVTISSNNTADAAIPYAYVTGTRTLTVSGLEADKTHQLTITYRYGQLTDYWAADLGSRAWPLVIVLGVFGVIAAAVVGAYNSRGN